MKWFVSTCIIFSFVFSALQADVLQELETYVTLRTRATSPAADYKCAFRHQMLLQAYFQQLPPDLKALAATLLPRPSRQFEMVSPSGHFTLHYDVSGLHAVPTADSSGNGIPDYIDSAAVILDHVWQVEIDQLGFNPPPDQDGNPVQSYPVYFSSMPYYGLTNFDYTEDIAALPGYNYVSYLELHNNYNSSSFATHGLEAIKVTAAHEFHHAIQLGYQLRWKMENGVLSFPDLFFLEMSSTFMEDYVYDEINDYVQYVNRLIPGLESRAFNDADGNTEYANALFLHLITQKYGVQIFREIWEHMVDYPALQAIDKTLQEYHSQFAFCFTEYASWFYFTGDHARANQFFKDASLFSTLRLKYSDTWLDDPLLPLHMRFNLLSVESSGVYLARMSAAQNGGMMNHITDGQTVLQPAAFDKGQIFSQSSNQPLIAVITNSGDQPLTELHYRMDQAPISVKDNPIKVSGSGSGVTFLYLPQSSEITIFNVLGQKVIQLQGQSQTSLHWDLRNAAGHQVPSGIYFYRVKAEGLNKVGKLTVLR